MAPWDSSEFPGAPLLKFLEKLCGIRDVLGGGGKLESQLKSLSLIVCQYMRGQVENHV